MNIVQPVLRGLRRERGGGSKLAKAVDTLLHKMWNPGMFAPFSVATMLPSMSPQVRVAVLGKLRVEF